MSVTTWLWRGLGGAGLILALFWIADASRADDPKGKDKPKGPPAKAISLADAIKLAEKATKGVAVKAERKDKPEVHFKIDLVDKDGEKIKIELNAQGEPMKKEPEKEEKKTPEKKPG